MVWEADELTASFQTVAGEPTRAPLVMPHAYPRVPPPPCCGPISPHLCGAPPLSLTWRPEAQGAPLKT